MLNRKYFYISFVLMFLDQGSKLLALTYLNYGQPVTVIPGFDLNLVFNSGTLFSLMAGSYYGGIFLKLVGLVVIPILIYLMYKKSSGILIAYSIILGGALGNTIDRFIYSEVVDFIDVYYKTYHWPVFNIADLCICLGLFLIISNKYQ
tara:strand:+ start:118 stop:561 length:444 start_codon:yes stop_codon:yes gene_type:complete